MNETFEAMDLSPDARAQKDAMLPRLLTAVRYRRRRRHAMRAAVAAVVLAAIGVAAGQFARSRAGVGPTPGPGAPEVVAHWSTFRDDPSVLARCVVPTVERSEWFVSDDEVNRLLQDAGRRAGIVRAGGRAVVHEAAFDPWPEPRSE